LTAAETSEDGAEAMVEIVLTSQPLSEVTIPILTDDITEGATSAHLLTFNESNWNLPQFVTITGADDPMEDGDQMYNFLTDAAQSSDPRYAGINAADVPLASLDNPDALTGSGILVESGRLETAGQVKSFTFSGTAGQRVYYDAI